MPARLCIFIFRGWWGGRITRAQPRKVQRTDKDRNRIGQSPHTGAARGRGLNNLEHHLRGETGGIGTPSLQQEHVATDFIAWVHPFDPAELVKQDFSSGTVPSMGRNSSELHLHSHWQARRCRLEDP
jgi:hypothetical protein